jgi:acetyl esterase/lipase
MRISYSAAVLLAFVLMGCARTHELANFRDAGTQARGSIHKVEFIGGESTPKMRFMLWMAGLPEHAPVKYGFRMYRVEYWTERYDGKPTIASGLISIPRADTFKGVVSYQHGTSSNRHESPSQKSQEGVFLSTLFAGVGYVCVAPDYIGLGTSRELHPYMHTPSTVNAAVDLLKAAHAFVQGENNAWPKSLFLTGFSQGGHATVAVQRELEAMNDPRFHVVASAPVAGAYDLDHISFPVALEGSATSHSLYLGYMASAYSTIYGHPIESIIEAPYAESIPKVFDGEHSDDEVEAGLAPKPRSMFAKQFLDDYDHGRPTWLLKAIAENESYQYKPNAPIRMYYGNADTDVSPSDSKSAAEAMRALGGDVTAISTGNYDHVGSILHAIVPIRRWFDEIAEQGR